MPLISTGSLQRLFSISILLLSAFLLHSTAFAKISDFSSFELDAGICDTDVEPYCAFLGEHDWGSLPTYTPGVPTTYVQEGDEGYTGHPTAQIINGVSKPPHSGIRNTVSIVVDGAPKLSDCPDIPFRAIYDHQKIENDVYTTGEKITDDIWGPLSISSAPSKSDFCSVWSAYEWVSFPGANPGSFKDHLLLYGAFNRVATNGTTALTVPFYTPINNVAKSSLTPSPFPRLLALDWTLVGNKVGNFRLIEWIPDATNTENGYWSPSDLDTDHMECVSDGSFVECVADMTALGFVLDDTCQTVDLELEGMVSRASQGFTLEMKDFSEVDQHIFTSTCGELQVIKETAPLIDPTDASLEVGFPYVVNQNDSEMVRDPDPATGTKGPGSVVLNPPDGPDPGDGFHGLEPSGICTPADNTDCNYIDGWLTMPAAPSAGGHGDSTDWWVNVISQIDYQIFELPSTQPGDWPDNPKQISCEYTNIQDPDFAADKQVRYNAVKPYPSVVDPVDSTLKEVPFPFTVTHDPAPGINADGSAGIDIEPTICTITNSSTTVPITLSAFRADYADEGVRFTWTTQMEVNNLGFKLYQQDLDGNWESLGELVPSQGGDTVSATRSYSEVREVSGTIFAISDVSTTGFPKMHGPFTIGQQFGEPEPVSNAIDWKPIRAEHESKKKARKLKRKQNLQRRMKKEKPNKTSAAESVWGRMLDGVLSLLAAPAHAAKPVKSSDPAPDATTADDPGLMRIEINKTGLYRVTYEQLVDAGLDLSGSNPAEIALTNAGLPVQIHLYAPAGEPTSTKGKKSEPAVGVFGPGAYIEFVAEALDTLYTDTNVYNLHLDAARAARVTEIAQEVQGTAADYYMETMRVELQNSYRFGATGDDPWYAYRLRAYKNPMPPLDIEIIVDHFVSGAAPVTVAAGMWGVTRFPGNEDDHHVVTSFNNTPLADATFDGVEEYLMSGETDVLLEGTNTLTFNLPLDTGQYADQVNLDFWSVTYPRSFILRDSALVFNASGSVFNVEGLSSSEQAVVYRVQSTGEIERITTLESTSTGVSFAGQDQPATYYVTSTQSLLTAGLEPPYTFDDITSGEARYLVIAHPDFIGTQAMSDLLALRKEYSQKVVDVEQIYAQYGYGIYDANAIKRYIAYAHQNLGTEMVHLIGGDSFDYRHFKYVDAISFIPSLYAATSSGVQFAPVDTLYADTDGDSVPDLAIGRTPVRTEAEFQISISKISAYDNKQYAGTSVFAAGKKEELANYDFSADSDAMIEQMPLFWRGADNNKPVRAYMDTQGDIGGARNALIETINGGVALTSFTGHSSLIHWGQSWESPLLRNSDVLALTNDDSPTFVTQWGCWNTYYVSPGEDTMAHMFMLNANKGAVAVVGASTLTDASHERSLAIEFYARLFDAGKPVGQVILEAKQEYVNKYGPAPDVILGWQYLGDPGLVLH